MKKPNCLVTNMPNPEQNKLDLKTEINTRLWYALGDIEPTDEKMKRAVESIYDLVSQTRQQTENERDEGIGGWLKYELKEFNGGCGVCGGQLAEIRGRYPNTPKRKVCSTCLMEIRESVIGNLYPNNQTKEADATRLKETKND